MVQVSDSIDGDVSHHVVDIMTGLGKTFPCLEFELSEPAAKFVQPIVLLYREIRLSARALIWIHPPRHSPAKCRG